VTVSNLADLKEAAESDGPLIIVVSGTISGSDRVRPTSDKTIIGEAGSCKAIALLKSFLCCLKPDH
jgi:pectate lyase